MTVRAGGWQAEPDGPWKLPQKAATAPEGAVETGGALWPVHRGKGTYELSDGSRVAGRGDAFAAQAELDQEGDDDGQGDPGQGDGEAVERAGPADQAGEAAGSAQAGSAGQGGPADPF